MVGEGESHFVARRQVLDFGFNTESVGDNLSQSIDGEWHICADIENLVARGREIDGLRDDRRDIIDVGKGALLLSVAEDSHGLAFEELVHEDANDVAVTIGDVLQFAINVVRTEDDVIQPEHVVRYFEFLLDRKFSDAIGILRLGHEVFGHWRLTRAIYRDGRSENETLYFVVDGSVDQIYRTDQVVIVVKAFDE